MKSTKPYLPGTKQNSLMLLILIAFVGLHSCKSDKDREVDDPIQLQKDNVIQIVTENMDFQMPDTIPSGWNTFRYKNMSPQTHFFLVDKYPQGKTLEDVKTLVMPVFDNGMKLINEGKSEEGFAEFGKLPEWFSEVVFVGGSGLISPGNVGKTTIKLDPGYYIIECYVKMSNGVFHSSMGMAKELIVSDDVSDDSEPSADIKINISSTEGIVFNDSIQRGLQTFSVFYEDQITHENFVGHDINLARLSENADLEALDNWMNWSDPKGLIDPAPEGVTFLGGVNDMPTGSTGYFTVTLEPGNYVLISEVPNPSSKNMLKTFTVSE
ncbi:MAG: hypothetical protein E2O86_08140 [Bacteroidetes bacterium]|nr:MAG: hypothetical protein E2O86_08140 [Bacteroidota bacterium]